MLSLKISLALLALLTCQAWCSVLKDEVTPAEVMTQEVKPGSAVTLVNFELPEFNSTDEKLELPLTTLNTTRTQRVAASTVAAQGDYPYAVYLTSTIPSGTRVCSGALITAEFILTAASCVYDATSILVNMGIIATADGTLTAKAIVHPDYRAGGVNNDIALVKLTTPAILGANIGIITLPAASKTSDNKNLAEKTMKVLGFGPTTSAGTAALTYALMRTYTTKNCKKVMKTRNTPDPGTYQSCLDTDSGTLGMCTQADVGGPVVYRFDTSTVLVGVTNYYQACLSATPNMFTRVGPFMSFITQYVPSYG